MKVKTEITIEFSEILDLINKHLGYNTKFSYADIDHTGDVDQGTYQEIVRSITLESKGTAVIKNKGEKDVDVIRQMLKAERNSNDRYCNQNSCAPSDYMKGKNEIIDKIIAYLNGEDEPVSTGKHFGTSG